VRSNEACAARDQGNILNSGLHKLFPLRAGASPELGAALSQ
jgi:hypothetical protein